jgi:hypothetical protein
VRAFYPCLIALVWLVMGLVIGIMLGVVIS